MYIFGVEIPFGVLLAALVAFLVVVLILILWYLRKIFREEEAIYREEMMIEQHLGRMIKPEKVKPKRKMKPKKAKKAKTKMPKSKKKVKKK